MRSAIDSELKRLGIQRDVSLQGLNSLGFAARAEFFATAVSDLHLADVLRYAHSLGWPVFVLGGGSNLVLTGDMAGLVLRIGCQKISYSPQADGGAIVTAGAGVSWHTLVTHTLDQGLAGLENLSLIPGTAGAAPVQNIGAYGVELAERLVSVDAWHRTSGRVETLLAQECRFAYRDSRFKQELDEWIILRVCLRLHVDMPTVTSYGALDAELAQADLPQDESVNRHSSIHKARQISDAVIRIRSRKLPDPAVIGNVGSFFHNPIVSKSIAEPLRARYPDIVCHQQADGQFKLAAGWLIDSLGFKGASRGAVGVHDAQALVLVNKGNGDGNALLKLAREISDSVHSTYGVELTIEPRVL